MDGPGFILYYRCRRVAKLQKAKGLKWFGGAAPGSNGAALPFLVLLTWDFRCFFYVADSWPAVQTHGANGGALVSCKHVTMCMFPLI